MNLRKPIFTGPTRTPMEPLPGGPPEGTGTVEDVTNQYPGGFPPAETTPPFRLPPGEKPPIDPAMIQKLMSLLGNGQ